MTDPAGSGGDFSLRSLLNPAQQALLADIKAVLERIPTDLQALALSRADAQLLRNARDTLDELFLIVVVGEFNSGKSNFINALLGAKLCRTGVLPTTETIQILRYGNKREEAVFRGSARSDLRTVHLPVPWLRQANLVDTPGTNAVLQEHQEITEKFIPSADVVLFVTSVERPFTESEKQFLARIHEWKKKVVVVLNKADVVIPDLAHVGLQSALPAPGAEAAGTTFAQIVEYVRSNAKSVLHTAPLVFGVSSKLALEGKLAVAAANPDSLFARTAAMAAIDPPTTTSTGNTTVPPTVSAAAMSPASRAAATAAGRALIANSGFLELEDFVVRELTAENKVRVKMSNPLSIVDLVLGKYEAVLEQRLRLLAHDRETQALLRREAADFSTEVAADFGQQLHKLENVFLRMKAASREFLQSNLALTNTATLAFNARRVRDEYHACVNEGVSQEVDEIVHTLAGWLVHKTARHAQTLANIMQRSAPAGAGAALASLHAEHHSPLFSTSAPTALALSVPAAALSSAAAPTASSSSSSSAAAAAALAAASPLFPSSAPLPYPSVTGDSGLVPSAPLLDVTRQADTLRAAGVDFQQARIHLLQDIQRKCRETVSEAARKVRTRAALSVSPLFRLCVATPRLASKLERCVLTCGSCSSLVSSCSSLVASCFVPR